MRAPYVFPPSPTKFAFPRRPHRDRSKSPTKQSFPRPLSPTKTQPPAPVSPSSPTKSRPRPLSGRLHPIGIDPAELIGKHLVRATRGTTHPNLTLIFADGGAVQVLVDGYDPQYRGCPKVLEMDTLQDLLGHEAQVDLDLVISDATLVRLTDKAFEMKDAVSDSRWDQDHLGVAFKFEGINAWHSVWATKSEFDTRGYCKFRSYEDVYLDYAPKPRRRNSRPQSAQWDWN